jgi:acetyltransferase-like isoleucine patch superfamily enzyme
MRTTVEMDQPTPKRPKLAETVIEPTVKLREVTVGRCCEILGDTAIEYTELGDYSYLGPGCMVADASIGKFCAIAAQVRIGAPNHPLDRPSQHRFTYCPEYYTAEAERDHAFFRDRRDDRVAIGNDVWIGHAVIVMPGANVGDGAVLAAGAVVTRDVACRRARSGSASIARLPPNSRRSPGGTGRQRPSGNACRSFSPAMSRRFAHAGSELRRLRR